MVHPMRVGISSEGKPPKAVRQAFSSSSAKLPVDIFVGVVGVVGINSAGERQGQS